MEIFLTYQGKIPSRSNDLDAVWKMRWSFHNQLIKLQGKGPFSILEDEEYLYARKSISGQKFAPLYGAHVKVRVELDVVLLTGAPSRKSVLSSGDLDNRLKRIVDALRMPTQPSEMQQPQVPIDTCFCLMDDDSSVSAVTVRLGAFLDGKEENESFAFTRAKGAPDEVTIDNIAMLF